MIKVLHIIPRFIGGGPERSLLAHVAFDRSEGEAKQHKIVVLEAPASVVMFLAARKLEVELMVRPDHRTIEQLIEAADIVHVHFWNHPHLSTLLRSLAFPPSRVLMSAHVLGTRAPQVLTEEIACFGDILLLMSRASEDGAGARKARRSIGVHYLPSILNMSRLESFRPQSHDLPTVGYVGLVSPTKMHARFAEMCAAVDREGIKFVVCGGGGGEDALRARFQHLGMSERVEVRGHVENVRGALEQFDIFGYPLVEDTYAASENALQEAMWVGIPPVVFPHGGVRCLVAHGRTGLVVNSEEEYSSAIGRLARDLTLAQRLGSEARRFAREEFAPERWHRKLDRIIRELLDQPRRTRRPLLGAGDDAATNFVRSLGNQAGPFALDLVAESSVGPSSDLEGRIAAISDLAAFGEGGLVHYYKAFPDDPKLELWVKLIAGKRS